MIDLVESQCLHVGRGFLAANAAGAEHGNLAVLAGIEVFLHVAGEFTEGFGARVHGIPEGADAEFIVVACIDQQHIGILEQFVPLFGIQVGTDCLQGIDAGHAHGDDLLLDLDLAALERCSASVRLLGVQVGQGRVLAQPFKQAVDAGTGCGHGAVDALAGQDQRAAYLVVQHDLLQRCLQRSIVIETGKFIECANDVL